MPVTPTTKLEKLTYNTQGWNEIISDNMRKLNDTLLMVSGMLDVNVDALENMSVLVWDATSEKWVATPWDDVVF